MYRLFVSILFCFITIFVNAQEEYWTTEVAQLIYDNCSSCHHDGGIAPFSLMSYEETTSYANQIHHAIDERSMPPWPADPNYRHFRDEAYLEQHEIDMIHDWIDAGMPFGDPAEEPEPPIFTQQGSLLETIDYTIEIEPYTLQTNTDEYRWFVIENPFTEPIYISQLEVIPGLENVVHHADLFLDYTGNSLAFDLADPLPGFNNSTGTPTNDYYINAWQPGGNLHTYPENWGIRVPPEADFVIEIHFGPNGIGQIDDTKMNLKFISNPINVREVQTAWLLWDSAPMLIDGPLIIPANEVVTFHQVSQPLSTDLSLISICPHMHWLGKSYKVWCETPSGETIPLIDIPHWDFHWQKYYTFQHIQKIPAGSILKSEGVYDNTVNNHDNQNNPPITVSRGITTDDEMFLCYFIFANYEEGDEDILLDSTLITTNTVELESSFSNLEIYPNPTTDQLHLTGNFSGDIKFQILSSDGKVVSSYNRNSSVFNETLDVKELTPGIYFISIIDDEKRISKRFVKL